MGTEMQMTGVFQVSMSILQRHHPKLPLLCFFLLAVMLFSGCAVSTSPAPLPSSTYPATTEPPAAANFTATPTFPLSPTPPPTATIVPSATPLPEPSFCTPLEDHTLQDLHEIVTQAFNPPAPGKDTGHHGVDFAYFRRGDRLSIAGVHIQSVMAGEAAAIIVERVPYGNMIIVETVYDRLPQRLIAALQIPDGQSLYVLYAHMAIPPLPVLGEAVACGETIGEVGNTPKGWSSDPHLHLEARTGPPGTRFADMNYYDNTATAEQMANYERWRMSGEFTLVDPLVMVETGLGDEP